MKYNELIIARQAKAKRAGRGISAGRGKTAGRGTKGQGSRKSPVRFGFEGGQNPLYARLPKLRGFKSHRPLVEIVYTGQLEPIKKTLVDTAALHEAGLISSPYAKVKLIKKGELKSAKTVKLPFASQSAIKTVEAGGGSFSQTEQLARPTKKPAAKSD
ncbi:MAG TPA: 50S ribosomal protein L15 [Candidatus Saccharimonadales bacterium]|nr:50S ribosomal protein L15 [Candidatus Saccharimonadales bacterium]